MPAPIVIELTPQARAVVVKLQRFPQEIGQAIKRGMDEAGPQAQRQIAATRFSGLGKKPFPVAEHRLRNISERLRTSLIYNAAKVETVGSSVVVIGSLGSRGVEYAPWHEYGKIVPPHFRKNPRAKNLRKLLVPVKGYSIPARAPLRHGIEDHKILFATKIQAELEKTLNAKT
jgi:hypothetical protein